MKYTIEGFSQEYALTLKGSARLNGKERQIRIDCTDLVILRWFVDFYPNMRKMTIDGQEYAWVLYKKLLDDLPILDISSRGCSERLQKLAEFGILDFRLLREGGTYTLYTFGPNYIKLINSTPEGGAGKSAGVAGKSAGVAGKSAGGAGKTATGVPVNRQGGCRNTGRGVAEIPATKDSSINDSSINDSSIRESEKDPTRATYGKFNNVLLSAEELEQLKAELPKAWQDYIDRLSFQMASKGATYANHLATMIKWATEDAKKLEQGDNALAGKASGNPFLGALNAAHNYKQRPIMPENYGYSDPTIEFD